MKTYKVFRVEADFLPGSQSKPAQMPREYLGTMEANSKLQALRKAEQKYPDVGKLSVEERTPIGDYLADIGSKGGKAKTEKKREAVRKNAMQPRKAFEVLSPRQQKRRLAKD